MQKSTRALERIEASMAEVEKGSLRYMILECAKNFKSSWINLGQYLMSVKRDKTFKEWGYLTFEAYCAKEIGIRKQTGMKLLRSYSFLEQEEPEYIKKEYLDSAQINNIPTYEAVNTLRQVKSNKDLGIADYERMKQQIFEEGREDKEVKDSYQLMLKAVKEADPEQARAERRVKHVRRMLGALKSIKREMEIDKFLSASTIKELEKVISKVESELA
ncbi:MAG: hypothetical protein HY810_05085 [Candidatus Omnitrophica bacterium]|nr:hypothetical protein [Candidatus Omnitrophota bacterium]